MSENQVNNSAEAWENYNQDSSQIEIAQYNASTETLRIAFKRGGAYEYANVPLTTWEAYKAASSIGSFFHSDIKGKFTSTKL